MKTFQILIYLILFPQLGMTQSLTDSEARDIASIVYDQYMELCEEVELSETVNSVGRDRRYVPFTDDGVGAPTGQVWMVDRNSLSKYNRKITARGGPNRCQLAIWPNANEVYPHLLSLVNERVTPRRAARASSNGFFLNHVNGQYIDNIIEKHEFRVRRWDSDTSYQVIEVSSYEIGSSVIGRYKRFKESARNFVNSPSAEWKRSTIRLQSLIYEAAQIKIYETELRLSVFGDEAVLLFNPDFNSSAVGYRAQEGMQLDRKPFSAYQNCVSTFSNCSKSEQWFQINLNSEELQELVSGSDLLLSTRTTDNEAVDFEFNLSGLSQIIGILQIFQDPIDDIAISWRHGITSYLTRALAEGLDPNYFSIRSFSTDQFLLNGLLSRGLYDAAELLIDKGGSVNAVNSEGKTPLHNAVELESKVAVEWLIKNGANTFQRDNNGQTALDITESLIRKYSAEVKKGNGSFLGLGIAVISLDKMNEIHELLK